MTQRTVLARRQMRTFETFIILAINENLPSLDSMFDGPERCGQAYCSHLRFMAVGGKHDNNDGKDGRVIGNGIAGK
jgi:hypothetical protein